VTTTIEAELPGGGDKATRLPIPSRMSAIGMLSLYPPLSSLSHIFLSRIIDGLSNPENIGLVFTYIVAINILVQMFL
jgi:hypothetical protein